MNYKPPMPVPESIAASLARSEAQIAAGPVPVYALAHGYGPLEDFRRRLRPRPRGAGERHADAENPGRAHAVRPSSRVFAIRAASPYP